MKFVYPNKPMITNSLIGQKIPEISNKNCNLVKVIISAPSQKALQKIAHLYIRFGRSEASLVYEGCLTSASPSGFDQDLLPP